jgi:hypothetical protein
MMDRDPIASPPRELSRQKTFFFLVRITQNISRFSGRKSLLLRHLQNHPARIFDIQTNHHGRIDEAYPMKRQN